MAPDPFERLRSLALQGIAECATTVAPLRTKRRAPSGPPETPAWAVASAREELTFGLFEEASRVWKSHTHPWTPCLEALARSPLIHVRLDLRRLEVALKNGTHRTRILPAPWIAVIAAALTHRELSEVRKLLRAQQTLTRESPVT